MELLGMELLDMARCRTLSQPLDGNCVVLMKRAISILLLIVCFTAASWSFEGKMAAVPVLVELSRRRGVPAAHQPMPGYSRWMRLNRSSEPS
jgi:hypothetical protein